MSNPVSARALRALLLEPAAEAAVLDVRSPLQHKNGHMAVASNLPYQELEARIRQAVPHRSTPVVLAGDPELDERAAAILQSLGYQDVRLLEGGAPGWKAAGERLYTGTNVRSKTLGEWVEHHYGTPTVDPGTVKKWQDAGEDVVVVDSRTTPEYLNHHIPGGLHTGGGAELVYRVSGAISGPGTRIVVNCQGRTRGIVGAQSLINTGLRNEIYSLRNGTPAWEQAGLPLASGTGDRLGPPGEPPRQSLEWAGRTLASLGAVTPAPAELDALLHDPARTTYLLDVRSPEEYAAGHLPGSVSAPGGQLVQATDEYITVRNAHVILVDSPDRIRAATTASWLRYLHRGPLSVVDVTSAPTGPTERTEPNVEYVTWEEASGTGFRVFDLRHSDAYLAGHLPGSVHARRETLDRLLVPGDQTTVVLVGDARFSPAHVAAGLAQRGVKAKVLRGGIEAAITAVTRDDPEFAGEIEDRVGPPDFGPERDAWYGEYFDWELSLLEQTAGDPLFDFSASAP